MSRARRLALAIVVGIVGVGCGSRFDAASDGARHALRDPSIAATAAPTTAECTPAERAAFDGPNFASLRPSAPTPTNGVMTAGSFMEQIQQRGRLVVGVDQNTLQFGYRNPITGALDGLDIELLREVARSIWPEDAAHIDDRITFKAVTTAERIPAVMNGDVDIVASLLTVTCERARDVSFSNLYYLAHQRFLVRRDSPIASAADLAHKRVCATQGSTSLANLQRDVPTAEPVTVDARTDCLVALQQNTVDAITADDTILVSFEAQDPKTKILPDVLSDEPYAIAVNAAHPEFVRFTNGVLEDMRRDGRLRGLYARFLRTNDPPPPPEPRYVD